MSTWEFERCVETPCDAVDDEPLERLARFYRANGYEETSPPSEPSEEERSSRSMSRGEAGAGWWSSTMTDLRADVTLTRLDADQCEGSEDAVRIAYEVETSGQYMTESDRQFWRRELEAAERYLQSTREDPRDLQVMEQKRAQRMERTRLRYATWGGVAAFVLVVVMRSMGWF